MTESKSNNRLNQLRAKYEHIPVPESAKARILAGIQQAEQENRTEQQKPAEPAKERSRTPAAESRSSKPKNRPFFPARFLRRTGLTAAAALFLVAVMANLTPQTASAMERIPIVRTIAKAVTFRTFQDSRGNYEADIRIPQISVNESLPEKVNKSIEEYGSQLIAEYEKAVADDLEGEGHYSVSSSYDVVSENDRYVSLRIRTTVTMASSAEYARIFTIDKTTGQAVTLAELFSPEDLTRITANIKEQMESRMLEDPSQSYFYTPKDFDGFDQLTGDESFYFTESGNLVIVFDEYTVAPGYMGTVEFTIPDSLGIS